MTTRTLSIAVAILALSSANAFVIRFPSSSLVPSRALFSSPSDENVPPKTSRLAGNQIAPTEKDVEIMDEMIGKLSNAKPYELPNAVRRAYRVISSPQFFLRIATLTDQAKSTEEREKLSALATNLVSTLDAVVSTTEEQLEDRAQQLQKVVQAAAEPDSGEFLVPLLPERVQAMKDTLNAIDESVLDEGFLMKVDSWMNKCHQDGMDLMVGILQKVLQMYAGKQISRARTRQPATTDEGDDDDAASSALFEKLLDVDADAWDATIQADQTTTPKQLLAQVQRTTESVVLGLEAGSMAQRVQAEYLQELMKRIETAIAQKS